jgi:L-ascorbate metabolism protein UlaG (beta-lactamase superfamily)
MRSPTGLPPRFREAGFDPAQIVANGGNGVNFSGRATHGSMQTWLVPAVHSTLLGFPAAGFILDIGGVRLYASGDTDLFGDMRLIGERYRPSVALLSAGGGPWTMDARAAAWACQMLGVSQTIPIHYGHNAPAAGPQNGEDFRQAVAELSPGTTAQVLTSNQSVVISA